MVSEDCHVKKVIVLTGPTAVEKTDLSLKIAKHLRTEIINADASQFRKGLDIGTAKIKPEEADVPHHLLDFLDTEAEFSIRDYQILARKKISELHGRGLIPLLVGGSGLYINAALGDYRLDAPGRNLEFEKQYLALRNQELHALLAAHDPDAARKIHPNNRRRVLRALEVALSGEKISDNLTGSRLLYDALIICLVTDRKTLYGRINSRVSIMIDNGWLYEVRGLLAKAWILRKSKILVTGSLRNTSRRAGFGCRLEDIRRNQELRKRQLTWFKNKMDCVFVEMDYRNPEMTEKKIKELLADFLRRD